ncbi:MAG: formimidoylglutamate deiminase [Alphaproteobacteria bacterium]|nr:formimidoylglutamate deiminase [Alphaproteobacteria bacterium]
MPHHNPSPVRFLRPERTLVDGEWLGGLEVRIEGPRIVGVGPAQGPVNLPGRALLPGFVNAHSHAFQRGLRGHVQWTDGRGDDFWSWRERMYALANGLDPDGVEAVSALAFLEMALAGITSVGEFHYLHHAPDGARYADPDELARRVIRAARRVGLRICLLRVAYGRAGFGRPSDPLQRRFIDHDPQDCMDAVVRLAAIEDPAVSVGLAPHSVRACSRPWLQAFADATAGSALPVHAHVAEQPAELMQCKDEHGVEPLELLEEVGLLDERFTAVHLTWPARGDAERLRRSGARVCACPSTELDLGDGFLPVGRLRGVEVCLGSDSHAQIDPLFEARALELHARGVEGRRNVLSPHGQLDGLAARLLASATRTGARSLGIDAGRIEVGGLADLVSIDLTDILFAGSRPLPALVFAGHPGLVRDLWVGGEQVLSDRRHPQAEAIVREAQAALAALEP